MIDKNRERHIFGVAMYMFNHAKDIFRTVERNSKKFQYSY